MVAHADGQLVVYDKEKEDALFTPETNSHAEEPPSSPERHHLQVLKSVNSRNQKTNPVALWKLTNQRISQFAFSPDQRHLAIVLEDGTLRVMDYLKEEYDSRMIRFALANPWQSTGHFPQLLRRIDIGLLVARRQIHCHRRTG